MVLIYNHIAKIVAQCRSDPSGKVVVLSVNMSVFGQDLNPAHAAIKLLADEA